MDEVGWELIDGVRSLSTLMDMVREALRANGFDRAKADGGTQHCGLFFPADKRGNICWVGMYYRKNPNILRLEVYTYDKEKAKTSGVGREKDKGLGWLFELDLASEQVHFFARPRHSQMARIEEFIKESVEGARKIGAPV